MFEPVFAKINGILSQAERAVVAVDGPCCSGKTHLGAILRQRYGCALIHMDHFFLPPELRTPERYAEPGGNIHHERFCEEVLPFLGGEFSYRIFDCQTPGYRLSEPVLPNRLTVVEGVYALHPLLRRAYDLKIFLRVEPAVQLRRLAARSPHMLEQFREHWIPLENRYFEAHRVPDCCDIVIDTSF